MTRKTLLRDPYPRLAIRPENVDDLSWDIYNYRNRDGRSLRDISAATGISVFKLRGTIARVDEELRSATEPGEPLSANAPFEQIPLSTRARNFLRQLGCRTVRDILEKDFTRAVRNFGPRTRNEIAAALEKNGFDPPESLKDNRSGSDAIMRDLARLHNQIDESHRRWRDQIARIEDNVRKQLGDDPASP